MSKQRSMIVAFAVAAGAVVGAPFVATAQEQKRVGIHIPVIANIYNDHTPGPPAPLITADQIRAALAEANKILRQANIRLVLVKTQKIDRNSGGQNYWGGDDGSGGGTAGDGRFTAAEGAKIRAYGGTEINAFPNKKGIKIAFGHTPLVGSTTPGLAVHRNPTMIVTPRTDGLGYSANLTGQTIAHELGHIMTLGAGHLISPGPPPAECRRGRARAQHHSPQRQPP